MRLFNRNALVTMLFFSLFFLTNGCLKDKAPESNDIIHIDKTEYLNMSISKQHEFWISRLQQIHNLSFLGKVEKNLINEVLIVLSDEHYDFNSGFTEELKSAAIDLGNHFNKSFFLSAFCNISNEIIYNKYEEACHQCIEDIQEEIINTQVPDVQLRAHSDCNCRWTCASIASTPCACTYSACTEQATIDCDCPN